MATETIAEGYVYIHDGSTATGVITYTTYCIKIRLEKAERDIQRDPKVIQIPQGTTGSSPSTRFVDLNKEKEVITINGYLADDTGNTALTKRDNIRALSRTGAEISKEIVWGTSAGSGEQKETVTINKIKIVEDAKEGTVSPDGLTRGNRKIPITAILWVGTNLYIPS